MSTVAARTALITGASRGIGRGIAVRLARLGFGLTVTSRNDPDLVALAAELREEGAGDVVHLAADLAEGDRAADLVRLHQARFGSMSALVLSGGVGTAGPLASVPLRRVERTLAVNFVSSFSLVQHALPLLREGAAADPAHGARVILLASIAGVFAEPGLAGYAASKAALISLAETLNAEESGRGVMATAIAPGYVDTDMSAWTAETIPAETMIPVADVVAVVGALLTLGPNTSITKLVMSRSGTSGYRP